MLRAGYSFLYGKGYSVDYSVNAGEILIHNVKEDSSSDTSEESEANKVFALGSHLEKHYGPNYNVIRWHGKDSSHFTPFSGGGDLYITGMRSNNSALVLDMCSSDEHMDEDEASMTLDVTPPTKKK